jgi:hypothetical protein
MREKLVELTRKRISTIFQIFFGKKSQVVARYALRKLINSYISWPTKIVFVSLYYYLFVPYLSILGQYENFGTKDQLPKLISHHFFILKKSLKKNVSKKNPIS